MSCFLFLNIIYTFAHHIPHFILLQSYFLTNIYEWVETEAYYISSYNKAMRYKKTPATNKGLREQKLISYEKF